RNAARRPHARRREHGIGDDSLRRGEGAVPRDPDRAGAGGGPGARGGPGRVASEPMFVLIVGAGRVGSAVAKRALATGHEVSVLDEDPLSHERLVEIEGQSWEDAGGLFTIGTALEVDALIEAGVERADVFIASTDGDNTNLTVAQIVQRRFGVEQVDRKSTRLNS